MAPPAPLVSIVIPAYNAAAHVASAIDSVLAQGFRDIELIVVDDGSADDTAARVQAYGAAVRCLRQPNRGVSRARNSGVEQSHGRLVAFLDADDVWRFEKLARQLEALRRRTDSRACYTNATIADQAAALRARGLPEAAISIVPDEQEAIDAALNMGRAGDLLLVFADALVRSWKQIIKFRPAGAGDTPRQAVAEPIAPAAPPAQPVEAFPLASIEGLIRDERGIRIAREAED